jgi:hypothetical protein
MDAEWNNEFFSRPYKFKNFEFIDDEEGMTKNFENYEIDKLEQRN